MVGGGVANYRSFGSKHLPARPCSSLLLRVTFTSGASVDVLVDSWKQGDIGAPHSCKYDQCRPFSCICLPTPLFAVDYLTQQLSQ